MPDVIKVDFASRRKVSPEAPQKQEPPIDLGKDAEDMAVELLRRLGGTTTTELEFFAGDIALENMMTSLGLVRDERRIAQQRAIVRGYDVDDLRARIQNATSTLVSQKPAFYFAVIDEWKTRDYVHKVTVPTEGPTKEGES